VARAPLSCQGQGADVKSSIYDIDESDGGQEVPFFSCLKFSRRLFPVVEWKRRETATDLPVAHARHPHIYHAEQWP
jgi:hypothetical protein